MKLLLIYLICLNAFTAEKDFSIEKIIEDPASFHKNNLTIKGDIKEVKLNTINDDFTYYTFKLYPFKKGNYKNRYFGVTIYNTSGGEAIDDREFVEKEEDVEIKGNFIMPFDEIEIHRQNLGQLYVNTKRFQKDWVAAKEDKPKIGQTILNPKNRFNEISIADIATDFTEEAGLLIKSSGYISDVKYTQLITGDYFFQIIVKDSYDTKKSQPFIVLKYYNYIQGIPVSELDLYQFLYIGQKFDFKGEYKFKEKGENGYLVGEVILNTFSADGNYHDYLQE